MPMKDRTGPWGYGPMSGRGFGPCGRGMGRPMARRMDFGMGPGTEFSPTREQEVADLRTEKEFVEKELENIRARLKELESKK